MGEGLVHSPDSTFCTSHSDPRTIALSKPERNPGTVLALHRFQKTPCLVPCMHYAFPHGHGQFVAPRVPCAKGVSGDVRRTVVEWQRTPAAAECRNSSIGILQTQEPFD